jgi:HEAT repeat protein
MGAAMSARSRAARAALPLLLLCSACRRGLDDWAADLEHRDPWRREMACLALRSAREEEVERAVRLLLQRLSDRDPRVGAAVADSLGALAPRAVEPMAKALHLLPPERRRHRELLLRLLREQAEAGDESARDALLELGA